MSISSTLGTGIGNTGAYGKHVALSAGRNGQGFIASLVVSTREAYAAKDAQLAERRAQVAAARAAVIAGTPAPKVVRQRKMKVDAA